MIQKISLFITILFFHSACEKAATFNLKDELNNRIYNSYDTTGTIKISFATLRKVQGNEASCSNSYYTNQLDNSEKFGVCEVSVPANHEVGTLDSDLKGSSENYFKLENHQSISNLENLTKKVSENKFPELIIFVHGFNVKFEEAILRAAQMKYDLKFSGEIVLYSWPAGADDGILSPLMIKTTYLNNQTNAQKSISSFKNFLSAFEKLGIKVHIIVHSMGHQVAFPAIANLQEEKKSKFISQAIFNAPDFDVNEFQLLREKIISSADRVTIYCSPGDNALVASSKVNSNKRVGSCQKFAGIDMVNVNPVDSPVLGIAGLGHGYYSSRPILTDLYQTILGIDVRKRLFIRKSSEYNGEDYILRR